MPGNRSDEILQLLSAIAYFRGLDQPTLQEIVRAASLREVDTGQLILLEGEETSGLYIVQAGCLKVSKIAVDGREQTIQFLDPGEVFNAVGIFIGQVNPATVSALEPSRVWLIQRETIEKLLDTHPEFARRVIEDLAGRVLHLISLVEDLSLRSVEARLARLLLENSVGNRIQRQRWATQNEIAARLGTVPDVVSRTLRRFVERGIIQMSRHEIQVIDPNELELLAQIEP